MPTVRMSIAGRLGDNGCCTGPGSAAHSGGDEDHAGLVADQFFDLFQRFDGGVAASIGKGACALASVRRRRTELYRNRACVKGLGIGIAHDEIHALDAASYIVFTAFEPPPPTPMTLIGEVRTGRGSVYRSSQFGFLWLVNFFVFNEVLAHAFEDANPF